MRGVGLRLNTSGGAQECLWPWRAEDQVQDLSRLTGPEWEGEMPSLPPLILRSQRALPCPPLLFSPRLPPMPLRPTRPGGALGGRRTWPRSPAGFPGPDWAGEMLGMLPPDPPSPRGSLQAWEPLPAPSHPSGVPVLSGLHFSSPLTSPYVLPGCSGVPPISLGIEVPHQHPAGALVLGRHKLCVFPCRHLDSTPP